ncbi:MAG: tetratricopeptide repeat protein [Halothece sp.]
MMVRGVLFSFGLFILWVQPSLAIESRTKPETFQSEQNLMMAHVNPAMMKKIQEAIKKNPNNPKPYLKRGIAYNHLQKYDKAIEDFSHVIELDPDNVDAYNFRGTMYFRLGKYEKALADYNQAIKIDPEYALLYFNRGYVKAELGKIESAIADFEKGASLAKKQGDLNTYQQAQNVIEKLQTNPTAVQP